MYDVKRAGGIIFLPFLSDIEMLNAMLAKNFWSLGDSTSSVVENVLGQLTPKAFAS